LKSALLFNKIVGTGIFEDPVNVLNMTGSKGAALLCWLIGSCVAISGLDIVITLHRVIRLTDDHRSVLYIEYGIRFPLTGGELYYVCFHIEDLYDKGNPNFLTARFCMVKTYTNDSIHVRHHVCRIKE
jgi:hypothetical protein